MARMIPVDGPLDPKDINSAERSVFALLKHQLPDEFLVIHSLPWLTMAVREVDASFAPTGEIDFVVLHPELGVLALEVKGGRYTVHGALFTRVSGGAPRDVLRQTRHNVHGLARWLGAAGLRQKIGYGFIFPHSSFFSRALPPGFEDPATLERLVIDFDDLPRLGERVVELMRYWMLALSACPPGRRRIGQLEEMLCPAFDGSPTWAARAASDAQFFLRLTAEQAQVVQRVCRGDRTVVTGWPGTGKTLIAVEMTRRLVTLGNSVLVVTFNMRLAQSLSFQLADAGTDCQVMHWHKLCASARHALGRSGEGDSWLKQGCLVDLVDALNASAVGRFDVVVIDEAQALRKDWIDALVHHVSRGRVAVFCDETQRFSFETQGATLEEVLRVVGVDRPYVLTHVARMPRAVTNRLIDVSDSGFQVSSPRSLEQDTLHEVVLEMSHTTLVNCVNELVSKGFQLNQIAVLTNALSQQSVVKALATLQVDVESVARFRGLEAPAVIIAHAHALTEAELFCAYSRATTVCVAVYDTEGLAWQATNRFCHQLVSAPANRSAIDKARVASSASELVCRSSKATMLALHTLVMGWSSSWGGWVIELDGGDDHRQLWIEFLCGHHGASVFHWKKDTRREFFMERPTSGANEGLDRVGPLVATYCPQCRLVVPHLAHRKGCQSCAGMVVGGASPPQQELLQTLREADILFSEARCAPKNWKVKTDLPLPLYALGVAEFALANPRYQLLGLSANTTGTLLYRVATICLQAMLVHSRPGASIKLNEFANGISARVSAIAAVDQDKWRAAMANALSVISRKGLIERDGRGAYRVAGF